MRSRSAPAGFTLIELLVVLILVGLLASLAVFTLGGSQQRQLERAVQDLYLLMGTASEQAVLNNLELGLKLDPDGYRFLVYQDDDGSWQPSSERLFEPRTFPEGLVLVYDIDNEAPKLTSASQGDRLVPDIVFFSSGETTPFRLEFTVGQDTEGMHVLASDGITGVRWHKPGESEED
ncbi:type II secretion system minor pseudopilin GspH [Marinobacter lutaoensis]|uniref:Type II secretion system protein H n=1 Tax=Marinobacter lutaoensis TaxID=135739 RepID=A0A1V2DU96_9GAMM|nr:type II secretion system minor pseudopilin GspH [Marinobacter lutaoensis]MBE02140.1 type II secretion system protein GspH [Marinobacter sp.]MBI42418.1 type II secretion system protein GspH [Oceanospirillales bacterium]NVD35532.1 type II secretion system minor pseudopilin GspH [Marinobacter lutaoensis]ONF44069.1 type II secretion system protein GspH [Marinobacter lutaoensis]